MGLSIRVLAGIGAFALGSGQALATELRSNATARPLLVELFTSQGCSSCPPAEAFVGALVGDERLWTDVVPVVYHVDYWDKLGWSDPFATAKSTNRQYAYRRNGNLLSVYTPAFVVEGREWRGWFERESLWDIQRSAGAAFSMNANVADGRVTVSANDAPANSIVRVALLGGGFQSDVTRGENRGRQLKSEFVALRLGEAAISRGTVTVSLAGADTRSAKRLGVAIWIVSGEDGRVLAALGGWIDPDDLMVSP